MTTQPPVGYEYFEAVGLNQVNEYAQRGYRVVKVYDVPAGYGTYPPLRRWLMERPSQYPPVDV